MAINSINNNSWIHLLETAMGKKRLLSVKLSPTGLFTYSKQLIINARRNPVNIEKDEFNNIWIGSVTSVLKIMK